MLRITPSIRICLGCFILLSSQCAGEFIIDDFDLDVRLDFPEDHRVLSPVVFDHGGWTTQSVFVSSTQTRPHGFLDVNGVIPSTAVFDISRMTHIIRDGEYDGPSIHFGYFNAATGVDLTAGGSANAIIIDVADLRTTYRPENFAFTPGVFIVSVRSDAHGAEYRAGTTRLRYDAGQHSLVFPFDSFRPSRGNGPIDFEHIESLNVVYELTAFDRQLTEDASVYLALDQIRTGIVPEPSSGMGMFVLIAFIARIHAQPSPSLRLDLSQNRSFLAKGELAI